MNKFSSIDELRSVKAKLYFRKEELELEIKNNFSALKHSMTPSGIIENLKSSYGKGKPDQEHSKEPGILNNVAATFMDILINDIFLRRTSYFKRFFMSYLIRLVGPSIMHSAGPVLSNLVKKSGIMEYLSGKSSKNGKMPHNEPVYTHGIG